MKNRKSLCQLVQRLVLLCLALVVTVNGHGQEVFNLRNQIVILTPLSDTLCQQSVYTQEALKKHKFIDKYLYNQSIYGQPIYVDNVYVINPKSKSKKAVIMELIHNYNKVVYYIPLHFDRTKGMKSYMWHTMNPLNMQRRSIFDKSSYYCKTFGNYENVDINNIHFEYSIVDDIDDSTQQLKDDQAMLKALRDSCAATYNQKELLPFIEKHKDKEVWLVNNLQNTTRYWKMNDSVSKHHRWLTESRSMGGTAIKSFKTGFLGSFNDISGVKCQCYGVALLPNLGDKVRWTIEKSYFEDGADMNIQYDRYEGEYIYETTTRIYGNQYKSEESKRHSNSPKGLLYRYYAIFTVCPDLTYRIGSWPVCNNSIADTLFVEYNDVLYKTVMLDNDFQQKFKQHENWEKAQWNEYNRMEAARYRYAIQQWGERAADKIRHGLLEFGFSPEMCVQARREEPYRIDKAMTPFGMATRYDFYQSNLKLYFIDNKLIGIQTRGQSPLYYM